MKPQQRCSFANLVIITRQHVTSMLTRDIDIAILSVRLSVCHVRYCIETAEHNVIFLQHIVARSFYSFPSTEHLCGASNTGGVRQNRRFWPVSRVISKMIQDGVIVTMECE